MPVSWVRVPFGEVLIKGFIMLKIAYLDGEHFQDLDYETRTCMTNDPADYLIDSEENLRQAILEHPDTEIYAIEEFIQAFNDKNLHDSDISDLGGIALVDTPDMLPLKKVTRVEVVDSDGRKYVAWDLKDVIISLQDKDRTLKIFVKNK